GGPSGAAPLRPSLGGGHGVAHAGEDGRVVVEADADGGAGPGRRADGQLVAQAPARLASQVQAQPGGGRMAAPRRAGEERVEDPAQVLGRNADAVVLDLQHGAAVFPGEANDDLAGAAVLLGAGWPPFPMVVLV